MLSEYFINIHYLVILDSSKMTFFNHYYEDLIDKRKFLLKILSLPKDLSELFCDKEHRLNHRMVGAFSGYKIDIISRDYVDNLENLIKSAYQYKIEYKVIFSSSVENIPKDNLTLLISDCLPTDRNNNIINLNDLTKQVIYEFVNDSYSKLKEFQKEIIDKFKEMYATHKKDGIFSDVILYSTLYNYSNIKILQSIPVNFPETVNGNIFEYNQQNQEELVNFFDYIKHHINRHFQSSSQTIRPVDYVISDLSNNLDFLLMKDDYTENQLRKKEYDRPRELVQAIKLINQNNINSNNNANSYVDAYINERYLIETIIAIRCASFFTANIKLPISNNEFVSKLVEIGKSDRNDRKKINILLGRLIQSLSKKVDSPLGYLDKNFCSSLKIISNLPIEWAHHEALPLMIRHEVSRVSVSPGWLSTKLILDNKNIVISAKEIGKIKIISSFETDDPIRDDLKNKLNVLNIDEIVKLEKIFVQYGINEEKIADLPKLVESFKIDISWHEVKNKADLIEALNSEPTLITIFDLHGGHQQNDSGVIALSEELVQISEIINDVHISPIILLSACDTNPIDRNHFNVANDFLMGGAKTVLASALPVMSKESSDFIVRLLLRIKFHLPQAVKHSSIKWSGFVTGMLRRAYFTELLSLLKNENKSSITHEEFGKLTLTVFCLLDPLHVDWYEKIMSLICNAFKLNKTELKEFIKQKFMLPECLKYIQMGNPDLIILTSGKDLPLEKNHL